MILRARKGCMVIWFSFAENSVVVHNTSWPVLSSTASKHQTGQHGFHVLSKSCCYHKKSRLRIIPGINVVNKCTLHTTCHSLIHHWYRFKTVWISLWVSSRKVPTIKPSAQQNLFIHSQSCHPGVGTWLITSSELHWSDCNNDKILSTGTSGVDSAPSFWLQLPPIVYPAFNCSFILSQQVIVAFSTFNIEIVFLVSGFWCNSLRTWNKMTLSMTICHGYNLNKPIFYIYI